VSWKQWRNILVQSTNLTRVTKSHFQHVKVRNFFLAYQISSPILWVYHIQCNHDFLLWKSYLKLLDKYSNFLTTLALGSWPSKGQQRCEPRVKLGRHISCSRECRKVWGNEPLHSQVSSQFGNWSPDGLSNLQREIAGAKIHWIEEFLISMESSWNIDV